MHPTVNYLNIRLCKCCNGTYFTFQIIDTVFLNNIYLDQEGLEELLCDNYFKTFLKFCVFNIKTLMFDFKIDSFYGDTNNAACMKEIFLYLYEETVLNKNDRY